MKRRAIIRRGMIGLALGLLSAGSVPLHAANQTWNGAGDGTTLNSAANWVGGVAPVAGDALFFDGSTGLTPNNNYAANTIFGGITFNSGAGAFTLSGNAINFTNGVPTQGVTNNSANPQTIGLNINLNGTNRNWSITGNVTNSGSVNSSGASQTAPRIVKSGPGTLTLNGATDNAFLAVNVNEGKVVLAKTANGALGGYSQINPGGTLVIALPNQIFNRTRINVEGGTLQVQAAELIHCLSSTNVPAISYAGIVENGLANTTNTLSVGSDNGAPKGVYNGTIRDGLAAGNVLNLIATRGSLVQTLNGTNTYSGTTAITGNGTVPTRLLINGAHIGGGAYTVSSSTTALGELGGSGAISASVVNVNANGAISPGGSCADGIAGLSVITTSPANYDTNVFSDTTAILTFSNAVNLTTASSTLELQLNGATAGTTYDQVNIAGSGSFSNNGANLKLTLGYTPTAGDKFTIVKVQGTDSASTVGAFATLNGVATDLSQGAIFIEPTTGKRFQISYRAEGNTFDAGAGNGNDVMLQVLADAPGTLTWRGDGVNNIWDFGTTADWWNGSALTVFTNNPVVFDDTGSNKVPVNLTASVNPPSVLFNATNNYVIAGAGNITGAAVVSKTNSGTVAIVTQNDTLTGTTVIRGGTFQIGTNGSTGSWSGVVTVNSNGVFGFNRSDDITYTVPNFSGTGGFVHSGSGALVINTAISFTGRTTNSGGVLQLGDGTSGLGSIGGDVNVPSGKTLRYFYDANATVANSVSGSGTVLWEQPPTSPRTISIPTTITSSNFTGTNILSDGMIVHALNDNLGYTLGNGSTVIVTNFNCQAWMDRSAVPYNNSFIISGRGSAVDPVQYGAIKLFQNTFTGPITLVGDSRIGGSSLGGLLAGKITGNYVLEIYGDNNVGFPFVLSLSNSLNNWGSTKVLWGSLRALIAGSISTNSMTIDANGQLHTFGNTVSVNGIQDGDNGAGVVYNMSTTAAGTLVVGGDDSSSTFNGTFGDGSSRALNLTKVGVGTLTLSAVSTNTGTITVSGGALALTGSGSFDNATNFAVATGATLDVSSRSDSTLTLTANQTLKHSGTSVGPITINGNLNTVNGRLLLGLNRTNTPATNDTLVVNGTLTPGGTLTVTNVGPALHVGDSFKLFNGGVSGFTVNLPTSDIANNVSQYTWVNTISSDGKITVTGVTPNVNTLPPQMLVSASANTLHLAWPTNAGWTLLTNSVSLTATNQWFPYPNSATLTNVDIPMDATKTNVFFKMVYPYP